MAKVYIKHQVVSRIPICGKSECSFLIPVTKNTGALYVEEGTKESIVYDTLTVLNTKLPHGVEAPSQERIVFHMGIHDTKFEELNVS